MRARSGARVHVVVPVTMIYVAAGLVVAALVAMASGKVDPLIALLVVLVFAAILDIAPVDQLTGGSATPA